MANRTQRLWPLAFLLILWLLIVSPLAAAQSDTCTIQVAEAPLWVVLDDLPDYIDPALIQRLFTFLSTYVHFSPDSPPCRVQNGRPLVVRFVPEAAANRRFPTGTEGFGGLTDLANWLCFPLQSDFAKRSCFLWRVDQPAEPSIVLVNVRIQTDPTMTLGILTHELAHTLGAVDGVRCPSHEDYNPSARLEPDYQDAYWWYGVEGVFSLRSTGTAWDVMHSGCDASAPAQLCSELKTILADFVQE